jgi:hypothetical protein
LILCSNSFFHVEDKEQLLSYFHRLIVPGGQVVLSMYDFLFRPTSDMAWPYAESASDDLMPLILEGLRREGHPVESRKEDREVLTERGMTQLFADSEFLLQCSGILRLCRTPRERLAFFRIPAIAQEVFPDVPPDVVAQVVNQIPAGSNNLTQQRNVYAFVAERVGR